MRLPWVCGRTSCDQAHAIRNACDSRTPIRTCRPATSGDSRGRIDFGAHGVAARVGGRRELVLVRPDRAFVGLDADKVIAPGCAQPRSVIPFAPGIAQTWIACRLVIEDGDRELPRLWLVPRPFEVEAIDVEALVLHQPQVRPPQAGCGDRAIATIAASVQPGATTRVARPAPQPVVRSVSRSGALRQLNR